MVAWRGLIDPRCFLFHDAGGHLQAVYRLAEDDLPSESALQDILSTGRSDGQIYVLALAGHPYLITSAEIADTEGHKLGNLTLLSSKRSKWSDSRQNLATSGIALASKGQSRITSWN